MNGVRTVVVTSQAPPGDWVAQSLSRYGAALRLARARHRCLLLDHQPSWDGAYTSVDPVSHNLRSIRGVLLAALLKQLLHVLSELVPFEFVQPQHISGYGVVPAGNEVAEGDSTS